MGNHKVRCQAGRKVRGKLYSSKVLERHAAAVGRGPSGVAPIKGAVTQLRPVQLQPHPARTSCHPNPTCTSQRAAGGCFSKSGCLQA